jgi:hypothetical protein
LKAMGFSDTGPALETTAIAFQDDRPLIGENIRKRVSGEVASIHFEFR